MSGINHTSRKRGKEVTEEPHIVRDFMIGNTRIQIADNCCRDKTPEDVQKILREIARTALEHFRAAAETANKG